MITSLAEVKKKHASNTVNSSITFQKKRILQQSVTLFNTDKLSVVDQKSNSTSE